MLINRSCHGSVYTCIGIFLFFSFSISLTFLNNNLIKAYPFPLSITFSHLLTKFFLASLVRSVLSCYSHKRRVEIPWRSYIWGVSLTGVASALDIGLSNWSFEFITVSLYTMTKSTSIIFILLFSVIFKLERITFSNLVIVLSISGGLFLFTYQSTQFHKTGFALVLAASALSGLRWTAAQRLTQKSKYGLSNPIDVIYHTQPWMALTLLPLSFYIEIDEILASHALFRSRDLTHFCFTMGYLIGGALLAFGLECSEFFVVYNSSSLTLSIAGIFKEISTLYLAATFNGDVSNPLNIVGLIICMSGICLHVGLKIFRNSLFVRFVKC